MDLFSKDSVLELHTKKLDNLQISNHYPYASFH
jgi:hypothetical protein